MNQIRNALLQALFLCEDKKMKDIDGNVISPVIPDYEKKFGELNKNVNSILENTREDKDVSDDVKATSKDIEISIYSTKILIIGTVWVSHSGGTAGIRFYVDEEEKALFEASHTDQVYTFAAVADGLSQGKHTVSMHVTKGNASNVKIKGFQTVSLIAIEI